MMIKIIQYDDRKSLDATNNGKSVGAIDQQGNRIYKSKHHQKKKEITVMKKKKKNSFTSRAYRSELKLICVEKFPR